MAAPGSVTVFKGFGGDYITVELCASVTVLKHQVDERTDWLWGIGSAYNFIDLVKPQILDRDHAFSTETANSVVLQYLPLRITANGFPCRICLQFVFWDTSWYTRYQKVLFPLPLRDMLILYPEIFNDSFYNTRVFVCIACGESAYDTSAYELITFH